MRLLILGGTRFLGRHLAQQALQAGHRVTLVHRGRSGPDLFPEVEHRIADRDGDLSALAGGEWDAAIDTCAYVPRQVRAVAGVLAGRVGHYQLVSSISAYAAFKHPGTTEDAPLAVLADPGTEAITGETYGGLKALCEAAAMAGFPGHCLIARPGLIVGPFDPTGRFTWWPQRLLRGGEVLAPGKPAAPVQFIDARDAAAWLLLQAESGATGRFNLSGPVEPTTMGEVLSGAIQALGCDAQLVWADEAFLLAQGVAPWTGLPLWLPQESAAMHQTDLARAIATGLHCRPLAQTVVDTAAWAASALPPVLGGPMRPLVGLAPDREAELLAQWRTRSTAAPT